MGILDQLDNPSSRPKTPPPQGDFTVPTEPRSKKFNIFLNKRDVPEPQERFKKFKTSLKENLRGVGEFGLDVARAFPRAAFTVGQSIAEPIAKKQLGRELTPEEESFKPKSTFERILLGDKPVNTFKLRNENTKKFLEDVSLNPEDTKKQAKIAAPVLVVGGLLADIFPGGGAEKNITEKIAKEATEEGIFNILKTTAKNIDDDAAREIARQAKDVTDEGEVKNIINSVLKGEKKTAETVVPDVNALARDQKNMANTDLNLEHIELSDDGKKFVEQTIEDVKPQIEQHTGEVLSNKEARAFADATGKTLERAIGRDETLAWEAKMLNARRKLADAAEKGIVDQDYIDTLLAIKTQGADVARKLQSLGMKAEQGATAVSPQEEMIRAVLDVNNNVDEILKAAQGVDFTNLEQATEFYRKFVDPTKGEWLDLLRYNSMLSSPNTHIINAFSNFLNSGLLVGPLQKVVAGGLDFLASKIFRQERKMFAGEAGAYLKNYFKNVQGAAKNFRDVMSGKRAYTNLDTKMIPLATKGLKGAIVKTLSYPMKLLEASDQFFMKLAQEGETGALTYRANKGVKVADIGKEAKEAAEYGLYRQELFNKNQGPVLDAIDHFTAMVTSLRNSKNPIVSTLAKFTVPFVRTPMNILKQGIEYSPVGFSTVLGSKNKTQQIAKSIIGSSVFMGSALLVASGKSTWAEPTDPDEKAAFRAAGKQPYSVKIGNTWYSYQKLPPPLAFPIAMTAMLHDMNQTKKIDDSTMDLVLRGIANYGQFLSDQSYAKSFGDLLNAFEKGEEGLGRFISNYPQQVVPFRALQGWLARLIDGVQRKPDNKEGFINEQIQQLMVNIPGLSKKVPARTSPDGKDIKQPNKFWNALSPIKSSTETEYASVFDRAMDVKKARQKQTATSDKVSSDAEKTWTELKSLPKEQVAEEWNKVGKENPELLKKVADIAKEEALGLDYADRKIKALGVDARAEYLTGVLKDLPKEDRVALWNDYAQKKIITEEVAKKIGQSSGGVSESNPESERTFLKLVSDYAKAYGTDPQNAFKAMFTKEQLGEVKGNLVALKRFYGKKFNEAGGSEEYVNKLLKEMGISPEDRSKYNLEHIVPVKAGGSNSPKNLKIVDRELHDSWTRWDTAAAAAIKEKRVTRKEIEKIAKDYKLNDLLTEQEALDLLK